MAATPDRVVNVNVRQEAERKVGLGADGPLDFPMSGCSIARVNCALSGHKNVAVNSPHSCKLNPTPDYIVLDGLGHGHYLGGDTIRRNILLVIAHPDDESMFFTPTINYFVSRGHNLHIVCMSTGNADGMGNIRTEELYRASAVLKVPQQQVKALDHPEFQDGFGKVWNHDLFARIIKEEVVNHYIDTIITFDNYGVSGHCNHRDVNHGICKLLQDTAKGDIEAWELVSTNIFRKYSGPVDIWLSLIHALFCQNGKLLCLTNEDPLKSYNAMAAHASQWVWFRKLFVSLSSYTYINTLRKMDK